MLLGSSLLPAVMELNGEMVQLGTIVARAYRESHLSEEAWNALPDDDRETRLQMVVYKMFWGF